MVLFHNITVGQRVEVKVSYMVYRGTVKYKGPVINKKGEWVGVCLDHPVGDNDGMVNGRRYFQCGEGHGVFVRASSVRFIPMIRCLYNRYHKVRDTSYVEEPLFGSLPTPREPVKISNQFQETVTASFDDLFPFGGPKRYPLNHSVGNRMAAATMKRPRTSMAAFNYRSSPIHREYDIEGEFISTPSIPKTHMPHSALKNQVKRGWEGSHYVREMSVGTGRDSMKFSQWNDVSP